MSVLRAEDGSIQLCAPLEAVPTDDLLPSTSWWEFTKLCTQMLCMFLSCRPVHACPVQTLPAELAGWTSRSDLSDLRVTSGDVLYHSLTCHWASHLNLIQRMKSKWLFSFQICLEITYTRKTDVRTAETWTKYKAPEPEVDGPWWISLLCSLQKGVAFYCWPTSTNPPWCKGGVASVCSCLSLLSSLWECGCKRAEKPACTQEEQECLQNK